MNEEEQAPPPQEAAAGLNPSEGVAAPEISRRVGSILDAVEREAARLREEARVEADGYLENARRHADGLVAERQRRIGELSDELVAKSEAVIARLDDAAPVRQGFENLVRALGDAAERLAHEAESTAVDFKPPPFGATPPPQPQQAAQPVPEQQIQGAPLAPAAPAVPATRPPVQQQPARYDVRPPAADPYQPAQHQPQPQQPSYPHPARTDAGWRGSGGQAAVPVGSATPVDPAQTQPQSADTGWREQDEARMVAIQMAATGATRGSVREHLHRALGLRDTGAVLDEVFGPGSGEDAQVPWTSGRR